MHNQCPKFQSLRVPSQEALDCDSLTFLYNKYSFFEVIFVDNIEYPRKLSSLLFEDFSEFSVHYISLSVRCYLTTYQTLFISNNFSRSVLLVLLYDFHYRESNFKLILSGGPFSSSLYCTLPDNFCTIMVIQEVCLHYLSRCQVILRGFRLSRYHCCHFTSSLDLSLCCMIGLNVRKTSHPSANMNIAH